MSNAIVNPTHPEGLELLRKRCPFTWALLALLRELLLPLYWGQYLGVTDITEAAPTAALLGGSRCAAVRAQVLLVYMKLLVYMSPQATSVRGLQYERRCY